MRLKIAERYSDDFLETDRPQPLTDKKIESVIEEIVEGKFEKDLSESLYKKFIENFSSYIKSSTLNHLTGFENFLRSDICIGCTQFIDTIYMKHDVQILVDDYRYHQRLGYASFVKPGNLIPNVSLIISYPFPGTGSPHKLMDEILNECLEKNIKVYIDGAWITCSKGLFFDFNHPAISSVAVSLSKGLGLGWNRIGVRWSKYEDRDAITLMNDFFMNNRIPVMIADHFLKNISPDHLWKTHGHNYNKICKDFNLAPTNSIHIALKDNRPVGLSPLLRYLENESIL